MKKTIAFLAVLLVGCTNNGNLPPPHPVTDTDQCEAAEKNLLELQCKDRRGRLMGGPNLRGVPFKETCRSVQQDGNVWLNPKCLATIKDCKEVDPCLQKP